VNRRNDDRMLGSAAGGIFPAIPEIEGDAEPLGLQLVIEIDVARQLLPLRQQADGSVGSGFNIVSGVIRGVGVGGYENNWAADLVR
jgi:hypothetical protein